METPNDFEFQINIKTLNLTYFGNKIIYFYGIQCDILICLHCEMIIMIKIINISSTSHSYFVCVCVCVCMW